MSDMNKTLTIIGAGVVILGVIFGIVKCIEITITGCGNAIRTAASVTESGLKYIADKIFEC